MADTHGFAIRSIDVGSQALRVGVKRGEPGTPLVIFNGIGANLELLEGVAKALTGIEVIAFDVPGVGGSPLPRRPYRFKSARAPDRRACSTRSGIADRWTSSGYRGVERSRSSSREPARFAAGVSCSPRPPQVL